MKKAKVLFFAADPLSAPPNQRSARLLLDEDIRQIREKVRASEHRNALEFDYRLAARPDDLLQALNEVTPDVVHFSGHGWSEGLIFVGPGGQRPHVVDVVLLTKLFGVFRGQIRVVVLNACHSADQARAIAQVVGCAIGMRGKISDQAAIAFGAAFYRAIGFGQSVQAAFDQGCLALPLAERERPQLMVRPGGDATKLFVLEPRRRRAGLLAAGLVGAVLAGTELLGGGGEEPFAACAWAGAPQALMAPAGLSKAGGSGAQSHLDRAKMDYEAGRHSAAFPRFRGLAQSGNPEAMGFVGVMFLRGEGTQARPDSGIHWLRQAAYRRDPRGMTELGFAYEYGEGVKHNLGRAREWYHKAAAERHWPEAMRRLGALYRGKQDHATALTWFQSAVKAGSLEARIDAGQLYEHGRGTPQDLAAARCLYRTAAEAGSLRGMLIMGRIYRNGIGVSRNYDQAKEWYEKAAGKDSPEGMRALGEIYLNGLGVPRDTARAERWFQRARAADQRIAGAGPVAPGAN